MGRAHELSEPWNDPIVRDVRAAREALFAAAGYDLEVLSKRLCEEQAASAARVVSRAPRRPDGWAGDPQ